MAKCNICGNKIAELFLEKLKGTIVKKPGKSKQYSVCFECKQAGNDCRLLDEKPCLGPITQGGCQAICISSGSPCYGCFGNREEAEVKNLLKILNKITDKKEIDRYFSMFLNKVK